MSRPGLHIVLLVLALAACSGPGEAVQPGEWEIKTAAGPPNGREVPRSAVTRCLRSIEDNPTRIIVLELIGSDRCDHDHVRVADGRISGVLQCPEFYAFSAHEEPISGRYSADAIDFIIDVPVFGRVLRQRVHAKRLGDCNPRS